MEKRMSVQEDLKALKKSMIGCIYKHFKGTEYEVVDIAVHSETAEPLVIYRSCSDPSLVWARPYDMFTSEVDHEKYPDVKQKLRFEKR